MSSTNRPVIVLFECGTDLAYYFERKANDMEEYGRWMTEMVAEIIMRCAARGITQPCIHVLPTIVPQHELDVAEVGMFLESLDLKPR